MLENISTAVNPFEDTRLIPMFIADLTDTIDNDKDLLEFKLILIQHIFIISLSSGAYHAKTRVFLRAMCYELGISPDHLLRIELDVQKILAEYEESGSDEDSEYGDKSHIIKERSEKDKKTRWTYMGLAAVGGGLAIGLTGGIKPAKLKYETLDSVLDYVKSIDMFLRTCGTFGRRWFGKCFHRDRNRRDGRVLD